MKPELIVALVGLVAFAIGFTFIAQQRDAAWDKIQEITQEAVDKNYAEFITDGKTITFKWK